MFFSTAPSQVCLYFNNKLYRGNRVTKMDAGSYNAFCSPNLAPLANAEVDITSKQTALWILTPSVPRLRFHPVLQVSSV